MKLKKRLFQFRTNLKFYLEFNPVKQEIRKENLKETEFQISSCDEMASFNNINLRLEFDPLLKHQTACVSGGDSFKGVHWLARPVHQNGEFASFAPPSITCISQN